MTTLVRVAFSILLLGLSASACTCPAGAAVTREGALERVKETGPKTTVFEGTVLSQELIPGPIGSPPGALSMTTHGQHRKVTLRSLRTYRGPKQERIVAVTGVGGGDCGVDFETGENYLVFADETAPGSFFTSICSGTDLLAHSMATVRVLRGEPPAPEDLLDYREVYERWTGGVCGKVLRDDGKPFQGLVFLSKLRSDGFPPETWDDPDGSQADGSFCVRTAFPGRYLLGAKYTDFNTSSRWIGFYPSGAQRALAVPLKLAGGTSLSRLQFSVHKEQLYSALVRVVTADGSPVPRQHLRVTVSSPNNDPNEYHSTGRMTESTALEFHYIPAGHYMFACSFDPEFGSTSKTPPEAPKWRPEHREVDIAGNTEVILTLRPMN
jgi:hypothetical protein